MRTLIAAAAAVSLLTLAACGSDDSSDDASADTPSETSTDLDVVSTDDVPDIVGQSVEDATAALEAEDLTLRVIRRDGEDLPATMDLVTNRVNVAVETGDDGTESVTEIISTG